MDEQYVTPTKRKVGKRRAVYFSASEQMLLMELYDGARKGITVAINKARELPCGTVV